MESRSRGASRRAPSRHDGRVIDEAGDVRLVRAGQDQVWHVVEWDDGGKVAVACHKKVKPRQRQTIPVASLLSAGRICLDCAQVLISAG
jgi:hypothetical protein